MSASGSASITNQGTNTGEIVAQKNFFGKSDQRAYWLLLTSKGTSDTDNHILDWISPLNFSVKQNEVLAVHEPGTGQWLLNSSSFKSWVDGGTQVLWCYGIR